MRFQPPPMPDVTEDSGAAWFEATAGTWTLSKL